MNNKKRAARITGWIMGVAALLVALVISFGGYLGLGFVPSWSEIYNAVGLGEDESGNCVALADVGNADCIVIQSDNMCTVIDSGDVGDNGNTVCEFLRSRNIKQIDYLVLTHYHSDHIGGAKAIVENFPVGIVLAPPLCEDADDAQLAAEVLSAVKSKGIKTETLSEGMKFNMGEFEFDVLLLRQDSEDENDNSAVISARIGENNLLFMADVSKETEQILLEKYPNLKADFLKVGHHGSATSSSKEFIQSVAPKYAAISCGDRWKNVPAETVIQTLKEVGADIKRTDINSDIIYYFEDGGIRVETQR